MNKKLLGNLSMFTSKFISGINANALKYLLPLWIAPLTCITIRFTFGAIAFIIISQFFKKEPLITIKQKLIIFLFGAVGVYGAMSTYLIGLRYTTPVSCTIILALIPIWVFILSMVIYKEKITSKKGIGLFLGLTGAVISIFMKKDPHYAEDPLLGDIFIIICSIFNAINFIINKNLVKKIGVYTILKWSFMGAAFSAVVVSLFIKWEAPIFNEPLHLFPLAVLLFILIFPTIISYLLIKIGLKYITPTAGAMYNYVTLIVATIVALIVGQDKFQWIMMISISLLCIGIFLVEEDINKECASPNKEYDDKFKHIL